MNNSLAAIRQETRKVKIGRDSEITLHGLGLSEVAELLNHHEDIMVMLFGGGLQNKTSQEIGKLLLMRFPAFAFLCVALAAGEEDCAEQVSKLPFPTQIELIAAMVELTMPEGVADGAKKIASAIATVRGLGKS